MAVHEIACLRVFIGLTPRMTQLCLSLRPRKITCSSLGALAAVPSLHAEERDGHVLFF